MKIFAIGHNYEAHNAELKTSRPSSPIVFMKPDTALLKQNKPFFIPEFTSNLHYEVELVIKINRIGKNISPKFAHRYYDEVGLGVDFTARDLQEDLKKQGHPWEICKAFDNSAVISEFIPKSSLTDVQNLFFKLDLNGDAVQMGHTKEMIFTVDEIIAYISRFFTLKIGDLIFTGTPARVGSVKIGDRLEGYLENKKMFDFMVK